MGCQNCSEPFLLLQCLKFLREMKRDKEKVRQKFRWSLCSSHWFPSHPLKLTLRLVLCSFSIEMLLPSQIWCFQICPFTRAYTKAFIISHYCLFLFPSHTMFSKLKIHRLEDSYKLEMVQAKAQCVDTKQCMRELEIKCLNMEWNSLEKPTCAWMRACMNAQDRTTKSSNLIIWFQIIH